MQPTTKAIFLVAALALLALPTAVDAATATAAGTDDAAAGRVYCQPMPYPVSIPWNLACGTLAWFCDKTDWCR